MIAVQGHQRSPWAHRAGGLISEVHQPQPQYRFYNCAQHWIFQSASGINKISIWNVFKPSKCIAKYQGCTDRLLVLFSIWVKQTDVFIDCKVQCESIQRNVNVHTNILISLVAGDSFENDGMAVKGSYSTQTRLYWWSYCNCWYQLLCTGTDKYLHPPSHVYIQFHRYKLSVWNVYDQVFWTWQ